MTYPLSVMLSNFVYPRICIVCCIHIRAT